MKNIIIIILSLIPFFSSAQVDREMGRDGLREKRTTYIALNLNLTMEEAILFKEKYYEYERNRKEVRSNFNNQKSQPVSEEGANQQIQASFQMEEDLIAAKRHFYSQLKGQIPSTKLILLPKVEADFKAILVKRLRERRRG